MQAGWHEGCIVQGQQAGRPPGEGPLCPASPTPAAARSQCSSQSCTGRWGGAQGNIAQSRQEPLCSTGITSASRMPAAYGPRQRPKCCCMASAQPACLPMAPGGMRRRGQSIKGRQNLGRRDRDWRSSWVRGTTVPSAQAGPPLRSRQQRRVVHSGRTCSGASAQKQIPARWALLPQWQACGAARAERAVEPAWRRLYPVVLPFAAAEQIHWQKCGGTVIGSAMLGSMSS